MSHLGFARSALVAVSRRYCVRKELPVRNVLCNYKTSASSVNNQSASSLRCRTLSTNPQPPLDTGGLPGHVKAIGLAALGILGLGIYLWNDVEKTQEFRHKLEEQTRSAGEAAIGGDWLLVDHHGKPCKNTDFLGRWVLVYFGFTHCPDVCPEELDKMIEAVDIVDANKNVPNVQPLFITIDPERDTPEKVAVYCADFSPKLLGITGPKEKVDEVAQKYRIYHAVGMKDSDEDYIIDHSIITYLISPDGNYIRHFGRRTDAKEIASEIEKTMLQY